MAALVLRVLGGLIGVAVLGGAGWAAIDPDDPWQNQREMQKAQTATVPARLVTRDAEELGERVPLIWTHGWYVHLAASSGLTDSQMEDLFEAAWINLPIYYAEESGRDFARCYKSYEFYYHPHSSPKEAGNYLTLLAEGNVELTGKSQRVYVGHSLGGLGIQAHRAQVRGRKIGGVQTLGTPWHGTPIAVEAEYAKGVRKLAGGLPVDWGTKNLWPREALASAGGRWLLPDCLEREELLREYPLDDSCYLYAVGVSPIKTVFSFEGALGLDLVMDGLVGTKDMAKLQQSYRFTGGILEAIGAGTNDGMVPLDSALAKGNNRGCNLRSEWQSTYNHTQVATEAEIHRQMARDLWRIYQRLNPDWEEELASVSMPDVGLDALRGFNELPYSSEIDWAEAACADPHTGRAFLFDHDRLQEIQLGAATLSWPSWNDRGQLLLNRKTGDGDCPVLLDRGRTTMLTPHATLASLDSRAGRWTYWKEGKLWLAELANRQTACALVADKQLEPIAPAIICGDFVYFASRSSGGADSTIWRVSTLARDLDLAQMVGKDASALATEATYYPTAFGHDVVGVTKLPDNQLFFKTLNRSWYPPNFRFRGVRIDDKIFESITVLGKGGPAGDYYMVADGEVRRVPPEGVMRRYRAAEAELDTGSAANREAVTVILTQEDLDKLFPPVVAGSQLATRP